MFLYTTIEAVAGILAGLGIALFTKKAEGVTYGKLDKAGRITNILLLLVYVFLSPVYLVFGMISEARYDGLLGILGWIVAVINASAALFCALGLGFSVALRKRGKSKQSFAVQFAGIAGCALSIILFVLFYGNLLSSLN